MDILALETSTELGSCALWRDGVISERLCPIGPSHSETLLPLIRELLGDSGLTVGQLDGIAFGVGPGAFTGLRVACGLAQGLAVATNIPLFPVVSLEALAEACGEAQVLALLDARMGEVYIGNYIQSADGYMLSGEIRVTSPAEMVLPEGGNWHVVGNAVVAYPVLQQRLLATQFTVHEKSLPTASSIVKLAAPRASRGEGIDPALAAPLYIRNKVAKTVAERLSEGGRA